MSTVSNYSKGMYDQLVEVSNKLDKANNTIHSMTLDISSLREDLKQERESHDKDREKIQELLLEIERLKTNNNKNSSNSSKPSSTNGFKKVITNNREKSSKNQGGQKGHDGKTLTNSKIEELINNGEIDEVITVEENKNQYNKDLTPIIRYEYDVQIKRIVTKHIVYPDIKTNIKNYPVIYGNGIKALGCLLNQKYMSLDGIQAVIYNATNNAIQTSKGSLYSWNELIYNKFLSTEYVYIQEQLMNALVLNVDETPIKINGEQYYLHNISDGTHTLQYVTKHRSSDDIDEFGFLKKYKGIIVHDHYKMYYNYGADNAECNVHVLRYLNGVTEFTNHTWAKKLKELLLKMKDMKEELIKEGKDNISDEKYEEFKKRYLNILAEAREERKQDLKINSYKKEEINLINRLDKYCNNHLLFLKKFFVPFSNNRAETDLRGVKIKQKTGKFRSVGGAKIYAVIKSCISTYQKNKINLYNALISLLEGNPILI